MFGPGGIGGSELLLILVIVLVVFGGKKIPELMGGIGKGVREFKKGLSTDPAPDDAEKKKVENKS